MMAQPRVDLPIALPEPAELVPGNEPRGELADSAAPDTVERPVLPAPVLVDDTQPLADGEYVFDLLEPLRWGSALAFGLVAAMGLFLALWAIPIPVVIAGWVLAVLGVLLAVRRLIGGERR